MIIRKLRDTDFDQVLAMMLPFYASEALLIHPSEEVLRRTLRDALSENPYLEGYGFEVDGELAGYSLFAKSYSTEAGGPCIWIEDIYIRPEFRGQGFGTALLDFATRSYKGKAARIRLEAEPDNGKAIEVYKRAGFETLGYLQLVKEMTL